MTNLLFKTYFRLNSISLCKTILKSLEATSRDMPPLEAFPKAHQVTFKYYLGVIHFLDEDYARAEEELELAYSMCVTTESKNRQLILTYLIPTKMIRCGMKPTTQTVGKRSTPRSLTLSRGYMKILAKLQTNADM